MIEGFEHLSRDQFETLKHAVAWITVLMAGADGVINQHETEWAKKIAKIRSYSGPERLTHFYEEVGKDFSEVLANEISNASPDKEKRNADLSAKLSRLNEILPLLDNKLGFRLYQSYKSFAKHVAKSAGGFLGFFSISSAEKHLMALPMVTEIHYHEDEEE